MRFDMNRSASSTLGLDLSVGSSPTPEYAPLWPNIATKREPPVDAEGKPKSSAGSHRTPALATKRSGALV